MVVFGPVAIPDHFCRRQAISNPDTDGSLWTSGHPGSLDLANFVFLGFTSDDGDSGSYRPKRNTAGQEGEMGWYRARPCSPLYVARLRGSLQIEHTLARRGAERLWSLLQ